MPFNPREKVEASCTEACKRAGMGYADGRCWDFAMAYLSAKKVLAAYREVRDAAKVVRVRRACAALAGCGDGEVGCSKSRCAFSSFPRVFHSARSPLERCMRAMWGGVVIHHVRAADTAFL